MPRLQETVVAVAVSQLGVHEQGPGKRCPKCMATKPLSCYSAHRSKSNGLRSRCKPCEAADTAAYRGRFPLITRERERAARAANPQAQKAKYTRLRLKKYGLTPAALYELTRQQGGCCASCGQPAAGKGTCGVLHVDHDHRTGRFRGLICNPCNVAMGMLQDNVTRILDLAAYAKKVAS